MQLQEETILNSAVREGVSLPSIHYQACKPGNKAELFLFVHNVHLIMASRILQEWFLLAGGITRAGNYILVCGVDNTALTHTRTNQGAYTDFVLHFSSLGQVSYLQFPCFCRRTFGINQITNGSAYKDSTVKT